MKCVNKLFIVYIFLYPVPFVITLKFQAFKHDWQFFTFSSFSQFSYKIRLTATNFWSFRINIFSFKDWQLWRFIQFCKHSLLNQIFTVINYVCILIVWTYFIPLEVFKLCIALVFKKFFLLKFFFSIHVKSVFSVTKDFLFYCFFMKNIYKTKKFYKRRTRAMYSRTF